MGMIQAHYFEPKSKQWHGITWHPWKKKKLQNVLSSFSAMTTGIKDEKGVYLVKYLCMGTTVNPAVLKQRNWMPAFVKFIPQGKCQNCCHSMTIPAPMVVYIIVQCWHTCPLSWLCSQIFNFENNPDKATIMWIIRQINCRIS